MNIKLKTLVIDDEPMVIDKLRKFAKKIDFLNIVKTCKDTSEALEYMNENPVDVIFTEVAMPPGKPNGIEFIESLPMRPLIVLISALKEYGSDAYRLSAVDFLQKPFGMVDFQRAAHRAMETYRHSHTAMPGDIRQGELRDYLFIRNGKAHEKVAVADIKYITSDAEYLSIYLVDRPKPLSEKSSFAAIRLLLNSNFLQIHRSTMINMEHVAKIEKGDVVMDDGNRLRVSDGNRPWFAAMIASLTVGKKPSSPAE